MAERIAEIEAEMQKPHIKQKPRIEIVNSLIESAKAAKEELLNRLNSKIGGISHYEYKKRLKQYGQNEVNHEKREHWLIRLIKIIINPLVALLIFLIFVSILTHDIRTTAVISIMVSVSVILRFYQEDQAYNSAESLRSMVKTTCTVIRCGRKYEVDIKNIVPGDIIELSAGDLIPADLRLLESKELFINQAVLTGEALPIEKHAGFLGQGSISSPFELQNICYMGSNVESGHAFGVVLETGVNTYFGSLAKSIMGKRAQTSFDKGIDKFTWLMITFMAVMVPLVFLINGLSKGNWLEAFLFGIAIAVGLTPEMLPAIVTINLSKGAIMMAKKKVIVKRLSSIQNFGAMNILCTDKTGTLTLNKIVLIDNINILGKTDLTVLHYAYVNSFFQTGFRNLLDSAVLKHAKDNRVNNISENYTKIDELPFDFKRRRLSIIAERKNRGKIIICKGAVEEVLSICDYYELKDKTYKLDKESVNKIIELNEKYSKEGFRVIAVTHQHLDDYDGNIKNYEKTLVFSGLMTFFDPPKESTSEAINQLKEYGVEVKVLTGDNEVVTKKIAKDVGIEIKGVLSGKEIDKLNDQVLKEVVSKTTIFAKLSPDNKKRVIEALRETKNNVVGFLGDGINDAAGLRAADIGISVDKAVDVAKESSDIILLEMSLNVLIDGVVEGRKVFGNIVKYIKMGASSNFGNMFSVVGGSLFLPFLPMLPSQILFNNLLYDLSQTAIPLDNVDKEYISKPRRWRIDDIARFMIFIGPISSIFDYLTYFMMLFIFHAWNNPSLFQTGWFVESLATQTLIVHVIRSRRIPFFQTWASLPLLFTTLIIVSTGIYVTFSPFANYFNFVRLPILYWPLLAIMLLSYILLTQIVKTFYIKKFGYN